MWIPTIHVKVHRIWAETGKAFITCQRWLIPSHFVPRAPSFYIKSSAVISWTLNMLCCGDGRVRSILQRVRAVCLFHLENRRQYAWVQNGNSLSRSHLGGVPLARASLFNLYQMPEWLSCQRFGKSLYMESGLYTSVSVLSKLCSSCFSKYDCSKL